MVGRRVGLVQLCNILGNTAGAVVTGLVLLQWLGTASTLRLIGVGSLAFVLMAFVEGWRRQARDGALIFALAALIAIFPRNAAFWSALHGTTADGAIVFEDRTGIAVLRLAGSAPRPRISLAFRRSCWHDTLYIAGHAWSRVPFLAVHGALGSLGAMLHPDPQDIFIIGQVPAARRSQLVWAPKPEYPCSRYRGSGVQCDAASGSPIGRGRRAQTGPGILRIPALHTYGRDCRHALLSERTSVRHH